ncbi:MAG: alpha-amylase/alpha-mannosidase [Deltaproteobacteria bacterium]|nr:alpha-amylase/alpha-mannosidase [Deltaproteobacteria bacterium]
MDRKLNVAFLWHMHQPLYKDPATGEYTLPWVLFHATKDYYDMAAILDEFPQVHQTFNLVPCLIEQINEYASGKAKDKYRRISSVKAAELSSEDKAFMLQYFFQANWDNMIKPIPRYWDLLKKRGISNDRDEAFSVMRWFSEQDFLDLQVLFNLIWIDPLIRQNDKYLTFLYSKGANFTEDEKAKLLDKQTEIAGMVLAKYAELRDKGIIEVSTTPYYHPILPLLCDSDSAKEAMPGATLPKARFQHPEDALAQIRRGVELYQKTFGEKPLGMWPSEGSVSMDMIPLVAGEGVNWIATDEEILSNSLKRPVRRDSLGNCYDPFIYKPYVVESGGKSINIIFRDHVLSDLIGFDYAKMDANHAASDFVGRLNHIHGMLEEPQEHLVSIILDGENAWEHFRNDGRDFLAALYSKLAHHTKLKCVTVISTRKKREKIETLFPGSWISHNFRIWIGHVEDNTAWDFIKDARDALVEYEAAMKDTPEYELVKDAITEAWEEIYTSEGSDWFWWYGEEHSSMSDEDFDSLFRRHIKRVYVLISMEPPEALEFPISSEIKIYRPPVEPTAFINPVIDGQVTNYFEWLSSGRLERTYFGSAMHKEIQGGLIDSISYGFSKDAIFFRFDYLPELGEYKKPWNATISFTQPKHVRVSIEVEGTGAKATLHEKAPDKDKWVEKAALDIASENVVELSIPFSSLGVGRGEEIRLFININGNERGVERWPVKGYLLFAVPTDDFEQQDWIV